MAIAKVPSWLGSLGNRVKNLWLWFPIIWRDEDWDVGRLYDIIRFKLSRMRISFEKERAVMDWSTTVNQLLVVEKALDRLVKDDYIDILYKEYVKKHGDQLHRIAWKEQEEMWSPSDSEGRKDFIVLCRMRPNFQRHLIRVVLQR